jgi:hypothetical protein
MVMRKTTCVMWLAISLFGIAALPAILGAQQAPAPAEPQPVLQPLPGVPAPQPPIVSAPRRAPRVEAPKKEPVVKIFKLKYLPLDRGMPSALSILKSFGKYAIDERTNSLIVQAPEEDLRTIEKFLSEIDVPAQAETPPSARRIRLVWLFSGLKEGGKAPPADLAKVVDELKRYGVNDLRMVAQTLIQTTGNGNFSVTSNPTLGPNNPCNLRLSGQLRLSEGEGTQLDLRLTASSQPPRTPNAAPAPPAAQPQGPPAALPAEPLPRVMNDLEATINAPPGHPVVLCACPTEAWTSVFVVEVIAPEAP